ncbi:MAG: FAD-dependent thymidylate synthase [Candidatus Woesearchaeota archaeon]
MNIKKVGKGKVHLIAGGGKCYTDIAARFVGSERSVDDIIGSSYNKKIVENIVSSGHEACTEFDYFIFGVEGYARVTEVQLVRKRLASYMIKSGRVEKKGKRSFDVVLPDDIMYFVVNDYQMKPTDIMVDDQLLSTLLPNAKDITIDFDSFDLLYMLEAWYNEGIDQGIKEEDLRYMKPQATEFKGIIGMNAHALKDWFKIRCCKNAQTGIRDMANKMLKICKNTLPDLFIDAGANCISLKYCPENKRQNSKCKGNIITHDEVKRLIKKEDING